MIEIAMDFRRKVRRLFLQIDLVVCILGKSDIFTLDDFEVGIFGPLFRGLVRISSGFAVAVYTFLGIRAVPASSAATVGTAFLPPACGVAFL